MSSLHQHVLDLLLEQRAVLAFRVAVKKAIAEPNREGLPVFVWSDSGESDLSKQVGRVRSGCPSRHATRARRSR
jgi:hypothetical protein